MNKRQVVKKLAVLMHDTDPPARHRDVIAAKRAGVPVEQRDMSRGGKQFAIGKLQQGRLSGPRRPCQKMKGPRRKTQGDVGQQFATAVIVGYILERNHAWFPLDARRIAETPGGFNCMRRIVTYKVLENFTIVVTTRSKPWRTRVWGRA